MKTSDVVEEVRKHYQNTVQKSFALLATLLEKGHPQAASDVLEQVTSTVNGFEGHLGIVRDAAQKRETDEAQRLKADGKGNAGNKKQSVPTKESGTPAQPS